ncbi:L-threonylcarbamoyladenylate synthase [Planctomycetaceae bacterium]|jgi:L-threonylcarbamoyladenylate synthase|nr:L-threonylcarbamoyladenylate synthase [Planctomycetaceae bacterium]MDC0307636.1 L-threonylcarbamoyladenylate synthase [Planctomycetaceae bacterium]MDG2388474.1 L-threonylcarbamoyladenylate synthase [Planctomycetaceae bacterium]
MTASLGTDINHAAQLLRAGSLVAFATETVYGLGADATNVDAVAKVFAAKGRPTFDPLIVHLAGVDQLASVVATIPDAAQKLMDFFWPGPMTLLFPKKSLIPDLVTAGLETVAVRIPSHPLALELLKAADVPVAAPSANKFGSISPTTAQHVADQLGDEVDYILDGGSCSVGLESTIVSCLSDNIEVLRLGGLSVEQIEAVIGPVTLKQASSDPGKQAEESSAQLAPGMLKRHYAPNKLLVVVDSLSDIELQPADVLLLPWELVNVPKDLHQEILSERQDLTECAAHFFSALRRLDASDADRIVAVRFPEEGLGRALNDRLERASAR